MNREYTLLSTIGRFRTVPGKKALHKILYFTNLKTGDFIYRWNNYGPYSDEVQQFFEDSYLDNIITVNPEPLTDVATQYNTSLAQRGETLLGTLQQDDSINHERINEGIEFAYNLLHEKTPRQMELLASAHYITKYYQNLDSREIWEMIDNLKPDSNFKLEEIEESLTTLHDYDLV